MDDPEELKSTIPWFISLKRQIHEPATLPTCSVVVSADSEFATLIAAHRCCRLSKASSHPQRNVASPRQKKTTTNSTVKGLVCMRKKSCHTSLQCCWVVALLRWLIDLLSSKPAYDFDQTPLQQDIWDSPTARLQPPFHEWQHLVVKLQREVERLAHRTAVDLTRVCAQVVKVAPTTNDDPPCAHSWAHLLHAGSG